jgi:hypothetical protein
MPPAVNGLDYQTNVKLLMVALYLFSNKMIKFEDIQKVNMVYRLARFKSLSGGIPARASDLLNSLREINYFITDKKLKIWLDGEKKRLHNKNTVQIHEFLFLIAN